MWRQVRRYVALHHPPRDARATRRMAARTAGISEAEVLKGGAVRVHFSNGETGDFHVPWLRLRDNTTRHEHTREQLVRPVDLDLLESAQGATVSPDGQAVLVTWRTGKISSFPLVELQASNYAPNRALLDPIETPLPIIEVPATTNWRETLLKHGAVVVRGFGLDTENLITDFKGLGLDLWASHFGRIEDLKTGNTTNNHTDQLGYTNVAVDFHTDMPFIESVPPYQALHCITPSACGGGVNKLADAARVALHLRATDREAFRLLTTTPLHFLRQQRAFRSETRHPLLRFQGDEFVQVRSSYFTLAPLMYDYDAMLPYLRAYQTFERLLDHPAFCYRVALGAGDFLAYDNARMLHARTAFSGSRWLRGVYFK